MTLEQKVDYYCSPIYLNKKYHEALEDYSREKQLQWKTIEEGLNYKIEKLNDKVFIIRRTTCLISATLEHVKKIILNHNQIPNYNPLVRFASVEKQFDQNVSL